MDPILPASHRSFTHQTRVIVRLHDCTFLLGSPPPARVFVADPSTQTAMHIGYTPVRETTTNGNMRKAPQKKIIRRTANQLIVTIVRKQYSINAINITNYTEHKQTENIHNTQNTRHRLKQNNWNRQNTRNAGKQIEANIRHTYRLGKHNIMSGTKHGNID